MCWTRSHVSGSRSMYSSSTPSVYGSPFPNRWSSTLASSPAALRAPLPVIDGGKICFTERSIPGSRHPDHGFGLDLHEPARIEQRRDDARGGRSDVRERLAVRAPDVVDEGGGSDEDPGAHDVVEGRARFGEGALDDPEAHARLLVRRLRRIGVTRHDRRGTGDPDLVADADRPRVADAILE